MRGKRLGSMTLREVEAGSPWADNPKDEELREFGGGVYGREPWGRLRVTPEHVEEFRGERAA